MEAGLFPDYLQYFYVSEDEQAIMGWEIDDAQAVLRVLIDRFGRPEELKASHINPFCILHHPHCDGCGYARTHGPCTDPISDFQQTEACLDVDHGTHFWQIVNANRQELLKALLC